jgi:hypothetical protein
MNGVEYYIVRTRASRYVTSNQSRSLLGIDLAFKEQRVVQLRSALERYEYCETAERRGVKDHQVDHTCAVCREIRMLVGKDGDGKQSVSVVILIY